MSSTIVQIPLLVGGLMGGLGGSILSRSSMKLLVPRNIPAKECKGQSDFRKRCSANNLPDILWCRFCFTFWYVCRNRTIVRRSSFKDYKKAIQTDRKVVCKKYPHTLPFINVCSAQASFIARTRGETCKFKHDLTWTTSPPLCVQIGSDIE